MKFKIASLCFALISGLLIMSGSAQAQSNGKSVAKPTPTPAAKILSGSRISMIDGSLEVDFPDAEGWDKMPVSRYPQKGLGYSVSYKNASNATVTIYVYNGGLKSIPNNLSGVVKAQMDQAKSDIAAMSDMGHYQNVKELKSTVKALGGSEGKIAVLHSMFNFSVQGANVNSEIYLFPLKNHFIKLRVSAPASADKNAINDLLKELDAMFADNVDQEKTA